MKSLFIDMFGLLGIGTAITVPFIQQITAIGQFIAVFLGITLAILSIIHKKEEIKHFKKLSRNEKANKTMHGEHPKL